MINLAMYGIHLGSFKKLMIDEASGGSMVKNSPGNAETWIQSLTGKIPLCQGYEARTATTGHQPEPGAATTEPTCGKLLSLTCPRGHALQEESTLH